MTKSFKRIAALVMAVALMAGIMPLTSMTVYGDSKSVTTLGVLLTCESFIRDTKTVYKYSAIVKNGEEELSVENCRIYLDESVAAYNGGDLDSLASKAKVYFVYDGLYFNASFNAGEGKLGVGVHTSDAELSKVFKKDGQVDFYSNAEAVAVIHTSYDDDEEYNFCKIVYEVNDETSKNFIEIDANGKVKSKLLTYEPTSPVKVDAYLYGKGGVNIYAKTEFILTLKAPTLLEFNVETIGGKAVPTEGILATNVKQPEIGFTFTGKGITAAVLKDKIKYYEGENLKDYVTDISISLEEETSTWMGTFTFSSELYEGKENQIYAIIGSEQKKACTFETDYRVAPTAADFTFTAPTDLTYSGSAKEATITSTKTGIGEITVKYFDSNGGLLSEKPVNVGTYTVKIDVAIGDAYMAATDLTDADWTFTITPKAASQLTIVFEYDHVIVQGTAKPDYKVLDGEDELELGKDFTVEFENNTKTGTATMKITGIGNYTGTASKDYQAVELKDAGTSTGFDDYTEGEAKQDGVLLIGEGTKLDKEYAGGVMLDGEALKETQYQIEDGCIKVTVTKETFNALKPGKHTLQVLLKEVDEPYYEMEFNVLEKVVPQTPDTSDGNHMALWIAMLIGCAAVMAAGTVVSRKRRHN